MCKNWLTVSVLVIVGLALAAIAEAQDARRKSKESGGAVSAAAAKAAPVLTLPLDCEARLTIDGGKPQLGGPHRFVRVGGKIGYQPLSLKTKLRILTDLHRRNEGAILLSVCPMETLAVAAPMQSYLSQDQNAQTYALLSDALPGNDLPTNYSSTSVFAWWWTSRWHPQMVATFGPRRADFRLVPCAIVEHLPLREKCWYQLAFTWNKSEHRLRVYVNGILCATTDYRFDAPPPRPELYLGNTAMAFADLQIYEQELSAEQVRAALSRAGFTPDPKATAELLDLFTVRPRPRADWTPDATWKLARETSFTKPEDLEGWAWPHSRDWRWTIGTGCSS